MVRRTLRTAPLEENLAKTLDNLGGEEVIRKKYPELYKAVLNTREKLKTAPLRVTYESGDNIFGLEDSCKIRTLNYTPDTTLSTVSGMEMETPKLSLAIIGDVTDNESGKSIDGFAVSASDSDTLSASSVTAASDIPTGTKKRFIAKSSFIVIEKDNNGNNVVKTLDSVMDSQKTADSQTIVKELIVNAPMPIKHIGADYTAVYYNRTGSGSDYQYPSVKFSDTEIYVYLPFSGSVELNGIYSPDPQNPIITDGENGIVLQIENFSGGCANFDMKYKDNIEWNVTGSVLSWKFPDNWHDVIKKNEVNSYNMVNFYCKMYINTTLGIPVPIVIQSDGEEHTDPSYKKIPKIKILWGCFAKDVLIRMENGKSLPIEQIKTGDKVMTKDGDVRTVTEIVTGTEDKLVHIKTASVSRIRVSLDHPMLTTEGMIKADELTAGTILITENGAETIESLYLVNYADKVYNLKLDREGILIANSFYAGDFAAQNKKTKKQVMSASRNREGIQEEFSELISGINQNKKNASK